MSELLVPGKNRGGVPPSAGRRATRALALLLMALLLPWGRASAEEKIVLQLDRPAQFAFAGYLAALWHGYFRDEGLDVEIKSGLRTGPAPTDAVREVTEGRAQFGTGGVELLVRAAQGLPLLILAPIFQQSGVAVYYRGDGDFASPGALAGARVGRLPASNIREVELRSALAAEGVDPDKLHSVTLAPGQTLDALAKGQIDAAVGSEWDLPWRAKEKGVALRSFDPAQYRAAFYGDSLFTLQRFAAAHPDTVERFRAAALRGWQYAMQHPDEIVDRLVKLPPPVAVADPTGFAHYQAEIAKKLSDYPAVPFGSSNPDRWRHIQAALLGVGAMARPADLDAVLYQPAGAASEPSPTRSWPFGLGGGLIGLALAALLLWLWRRGRREAAGRRLVPAPTAAALADELHRIAEAIAQPLDQLRPPTLAQPLLARAWATAQGGVGRLEATASRLAQSAAPPVLEPRPADLNAALGELSDPIRRRLPGGVDFRYSLLPDPWLCEADPGAVATAVLDLVGAAGDSVGDGGNIILGTRHFAIDAATAAEYDGTEPGDYVRVTVRDSGAGLSQDRLDRALDPETTSDPAICAASELARRLGGFARVETAEGVGTAVHLYFRRIAAANDPREEERPAKAAE